jgi:subtilisin family serine protease
VDDGRIKPDIVANGVALYSASSSLTGSATYEEKTGTSMASPSVAGSLALLQQHSFSLTGS